jgi:hypothetical protein
VSEVANGNLPILEKLGDIRDQFRKELGQVPGSDVDMRILLHF